MITKEKIFLFSLILLLVSCAKLQEVKEVKGVKEHPNEKKYPLLESVVSGSYGLKGKVKEVGGYIKYNNEESDKKNSYEGLRHYDIQSPYFRIFNEWGGSVRSALKFDVDTLTLTVKDTLKYRKVDYLDGKEKSARYIDKKFEYPILNPHPIYSNYRVYNDNQILKNDYWFYEYVLEFHYTYNEDGYPLEEKYYRLFDKNRNGKYDKGEERELMTTTVFNYDNNNKILSKEIRYKDGNTPSDQFDTFHVEEFDIDNTSVARYEYRYDDEDRMTEVSLYVNKSPLKKIKYTYHPEGWVKKREIDAYVAGSMFHEDGWKFVVEFDENADFTKGWTYNSKGELLSKRRYEYKEFDSHNNWLKCDLYTNNDESRPAVIYKRRIEYFED